MHEAVPGPGSEGVFFPSSPPGFRLDIRAYSRARSGLLFAMSKIGPMLCTDAVYGCCGRPEKEGVRGLVLLTCPGPAREAAGVANPVAAAAADQPLQRVQAKSRIDESWYVKPGMYGSYHRIANTNVHHRAPMFRPAWALASVASIGMHACMYPTARARVGGGAVWVVSPRGV